MEGPSTRETDKLSLSAHKSVGSRRGCEFTGQRTRPPNLHIDDFATASSLPFVHDQRQKHCLLHTSVTMAVINPDELLAQLTSEEKIKLLSGDDMWHTVAVPRLSIPRVRVSYILDLVSCTLVLMTDLE